MIRTALILPIVLSASAFAAEPTPTAPSPTAPSATVPAFADLDVNKDGALDKTEVAKNEVLTRDFALVDTDKNGKLSSAEYKAWSDKQSKPAQPAK
jgi:hypothetical protein